MNEDTDKIKRLRVLWAALKETSEYKLNQIKIDCRDNTLVITNSEKFETIGTFFSPHLSVLATLMNFSTYIGTTAGVVELYMY